MPTTSNLMTYRQHPEKPQAQRNCPLAITQASPPQSWRLVKARVWKKRWRQGWRGWTTLWRPCGRWDPAPTRLPPPIRCPSARRCTPAAPRIHAAGAQLAHAVFYSSRAAGSPVAQGPAAAWPPRMRQDRCGTCGCPRVRRRHALGDSSIHCGRLHRQAAVVLPQPGLCGCSCMSPAPLPNTYTTHLPTPLGALLLCSVVQASQSAGYVMSLLQPTRMRRLASWWSSSWMRQVCSWAGHVHFGAGRAGSACPIAQQACLLLHVVCCS